MIILDLLYSIKRVPYWFYSYFVHGCFHSKLSTLPLKQLSGGYTLTCMNCGTPVPTLFSIQTVNYPTSEALKVHKRMPRLKKVTPIREGQSSLERSALLSGKKMVG